MNKGYLIALVREKETIKVYGSPADRNDCDEILEINGKSLSVEENVRHAELVDHISQCIRLRNICLRVKRAPTQLTYGNDSSLLDVFVIGTNAHEQLNRFFKIINILADPDDLLKITDKMELAEFNNVNQSPVNSNGAFNINQHQQIINNQQAQQNPANQMNSSQAHLYRNHHQQQQQGIRYINNPKVLKHRELPVDVPDSFVGIAKQSPKYPPPKPHRQVSPPMPLNNLTTFNQTPSSLPYSSHDAISGCVQQPAILPLSQNAAANIVTHNSSLRSSVKLKQLEKSRNGQNSNYPIGQLQPAINQAFELNEDESVPITANQTTNNQSNSNTKQALRLEQTMPDLCSIYNRLQRNLNGDFADVSGDAKLAKLLSIYNTIVQIHNKKSRVPVLSSRHSFVVNAQGDQEQLVYKVSELLQSVITLLNTEQMTNDVAELLSILCKHEVEGVCSAFDRIVQSFEYAKTSRTPSPEVSVEMVSENGQTDLYSHKQIGLQQLQPHSQLDDYDYAPDQVQLDIENNLYQTSLHPLTDIDLNGIKTVRINKDSNQALGATIKNEGDMSVIIGRIVCGGAAHRSGLLHEGDEILEVNGRPMRGLNVNDVVNLLEDMNGSLVFTINSKSHNKPPQRILQERIFVRAFFKFDACNTELIPCKELGLSFEAGEILCIIDQSDPNWWQAHREKDSEHRLAGLIPSHKFMKQLENQLESRHEEMETDYTKNEKRNLISMLFNCPKGTSPRRRKNLQNLTLFGPNEKPYYEEVWCEYPTKFCKRPIILVGPKLIGQREIIAKLLQDSNRFAKAISHTSKPRQDHERNGIDFHFVTQQQFEADIRANKFIEYGQYQHHFYGTSLEAMKEVVKSKKTCIHLVNTTSIINFRQGPAGRELKPSFVFVRPDNSHPDKLRNIVSKFSQPKSNIDENIKLIMEEVELIEANYLPYFDVVITVSDVERAYQELLTEIDRIEKEPQWIPLFWQDKPPNN